MKRCETKISKCCVSNKKRHSRKLDILESEWERVRERLSSFSLNHCAISFTIHIQNECWMTLLLAHSIAFDLILYFAKREEEKEAEEKKNSNYHQWQKHSWNHICAVISRCSQFLYTHTHVFHHYHHSMAFCYSTRPLKYIDLSFFLDVITYHCIISMYHWSTMLSYMPHILPFYLFAAVCHRFGIHIQKFMLSLAFSTKSMKKKQWTH